MSDIVAGIERIVAETVFEEDEQPAEAAERIVWFLAHRDEAEVLELLRAIRS